MRAARAKDPQPATEPRLGLIGDIADELRWIATSRKGWLIGLSLNFAVAVVYVGFTHYDPHRPSDIRIAHVGTAVAIWVLSNTLNTNQLGADSDRALASLRRGDTAARILAIKNLSLAVFLVPVALIISVVVRILVDRWRLLPHAAMADVGAVFLWLGLGSVISVLLPYRPIALRERWKARRTWLRWGLCLAVPNLSYFTVMPVLHLPYFAVYQLQVFGRYQPHFLAYSFFYLAMGLAYWALGLWLASLYARRRSSRFTADLARRT